MPQLPFVQCMAVAALVSIVLVGLAVPVGASAGVRAGRLLIRVSFIGVLIVFGVCLAWGWSTGDLALFNARMGIGAWVQMGAFFAIVYSIGYGFASSYLLDKAAEQAGGRSSKHEDGKGRSGGSDG